MLLRTSKAWILTTGLVLGAVVLCGCHNTIQLIGSPDQPGKVVVYPQQGDIIKWNGVTPNFLGPAPCTPDANGKCTVNVPDGSYLYDCGGCTDPEIVVGPQSGGPLRGRMAAAAALTTPDVVSLWCNNSQVTLTPAASPFTAHAGDTLELLWVNTGTGSQKISDPVVTPGQPTPVPCTEKQIGAPPNNHCTFIAPAAATTYNYTAKSAGGACGGTSAAGTIAVTIQ